MTSRVFEGLANAAPSFFRWGAGAWNALAGPLRLRHPRAALEISPSGIKAVRANTTRGGARALAWTRRELEPGVLDVGLAKMTVARPGDLARHIARALESVGAAEEEVSVFFPSLAARAVTLDFDSFPASPAEQLDMVRWKISAKIPYLPSEARIAYEPAGGGDAKTRVFAVAMPKTAAEAIEEACEAAGVRVGFMQPMLIHILAAGALSEPTLVVSAGAGHVSLGIARGSEMLLIREKDSSHLDAADRVEMCVREARTTANYGQERMGVSVVACRFVPDDPSLAGLADRLSAELGFTVEPCPWPPELLPEPAFPSSEMFGVFAPLAWAVSSP